MSLSSLSPPPVVGGLYTLSLRRRHRNAQDVGECRLRQREDGSVAADDVAVAEETDAAKEVLYVWRLDAGHGVKTWVGRWAHDLQRYIYIC
jgi:hypothetical protein